MHNNIPCYATLIPDALHLLFKGYSYNSDPTSIYLYMCYVFGKEAGEAVWSNFNSHTVYAYKAWLEYIDEADRDLEMFGIYGVIR